MVGEKARAVERLVQRLEEDLAERATVQHDVRLPEKQSGRGRQVDVLVTFQDSYRSVRWVYEVKCHRRPVGPDVMEQWATLQRDLDVQRVVLVSTSGYTQGAREKAAQHGIILHDLEETLHQELDFVSPVIRQYRPTVLRCAFHPTIQAPPGASLKGLTPESLWISLPGRQRQPAAAALRTIVVDEVKRRLSEGEIELGWDEEQHDIELDIPTRGLRVGAPGIAGISLLSLRAKVLLQNVAQEIPVPIKRWKYRTADPGGHRDVFIMDLEPVLPNHSMEVAIESSADGSWRVVRIARGDPDLLDKGAG